MGRDEKKMTTPKTATLLLAGVLVLTLAAAACGSDVRRGAAPPIDGTCAAGIVLRAGEECRHEYSWVADTHIGAGGVARPTIESASITFRVDTQGVGHYGNMLWGRRIERNLDIANDIIGFSAFAQSDGSFYIERADTTVASPGPPEWEWGGPACTKRMVLRAGDSCRIPSDAGKFVKFEVSASGDGCFSGSVCSKRSIRMGGFSAKREGEAWVVESAP